MANPSKASRLSSLAGAASLGVAPSGIAAASAEVHLQVQQERAAGLPGRPVTPKERRALQEAALLRKLAKERLRELKRRLPSSFTVPNIAQERFMRSFRTKPFPQEVIFLGGNGTGKTYVGCMTVAGFVWGEKAMPGRGVHPDWDGMKEYEGWRIYRERSQKENRKISGRIVAVADSLKGNGAVMQRIQRLWPRGLWQGRKLGKSYVSEIWCWDRAEDVGNDELAVAVIEVKTHDQPADQHRGPDCDFIWFDEPPPPDVYEEAIGRLRANEFGCMLFTLTPLELAGWLIDQLVDPADGVKTVVVYGSLWDNCKDWHPDAVVWSGGAPGEGRPLNRGNLARSRIDSMIENWKRVSPETVEARVYGKAVHLAGAIYKSWNPAVHMADEIPGDWSEWPVWCIIDPHHARPPMVIWVAQGPHASYAIAEWPDEDYTKIGQIRGGIPEWAVNIKALEEPVERQVVQRYGDPNSLKFVYSNGNGGGLPISIQDQYHNEGLWFDLADDNLRAGHEEVNRLLHCDQALGVPPRFYCLKNNLFTGRPMVNIPNAMQRYGFKASALAANTKPSGNLTSIVDQTYKDAADVVRYFAMSSRDVPFQPVSSKSSMEEAFLRARSKRNAVEDRGRRDVVTGWKGIRGQGALAKSSGRR